MAGKGIIKMIRWIKDRLKKEEEVIEETKRLSDTLQVRVNEIGKRVEKLTINGDTCFYLCEGEPENRVCINDDDK